MSGTRETDENTAAGNGDGFDPREAAALIEQSKRQARRQFQPNPPLLSLIRAVIVLAAYGAIWLSVRGQHPYKGPNGLAIALVYTLVAIVIGASVTATRRANAGVGGNPSGAGVPRSPSCWWHGSPCTCSWGRWSTPG